MRHDKEKPMNSIEEIIQEIKNKIDSGFFGFPRIIEYDEWRARNYETDNDSIMDRFWNMCKNRVIVEDIGQPILKKYNAIRESNHQATYEMLQDDLNNTLDKLNNYEVEVPKSLEQIDLYLGYPLAWANPDDELSLSYLVAQVIRDIANLTYTYALDEIKKAQKDLEDITRKAYQDYLQKGDNYVLINEIRKIIEWLYQAEGNGDYCEKHSPLEILKYTKTARTLRSAWDCLSQMVNSDSKNLDDYESFLSENGKPSLNDDIKKRISYELNLNDGDLKKAAKSIKDQCDKLYRNDIKDACKAFEDEIEVQGDDGIAISKKGLCRLKEDLNRIGEHAVNHWLYGKENDWSGILCSSDIQKWGQMHARGKEECCKCSDFVKSEKNNTRALIAQLSQFQDTLLNEYLGTYGVRYTHIMQQLYQLHDIATFGKKIIDLLAFRGFDQSDSIQIYAAGLFNGGITFDDNNIEVSTGFNTKDISSIFLYQGDISSLFVSDLIDFADKMSTNYHSHISLGSIFKIVEKEIEEKEKITKKLEEYPCLLPPYLLHYDCLNPISDSIQRDLGIFETKEELLERNPYFKPLEQNLRRIRDKLVVIDRIVAESYRFEYFSKPVLQRMAVHDECIYLLNKEKIEKAANTVIDMLEININVMVYMYNTSVDLINSIKVKGSWITRRIFGYRYNDFFGYRTDDSIKLELMLTTFNQLGQYLKTLRPDIDLELEKPTLDNIRKIRNEYKDSDRLTIDKAARELKDKYKTTAVRLNKYNRAIDNTLRLLKESILKAFLCGRGNITSLSDVKAEMFQNLLPESNEF